MNIVPQQQTAVDAVVVAPNMTALEARQCIDEIKGHLNSVRLLLLDLDERRGWEALGYSSMRHCMVGEFGRSQSQLYRELKAGKIEREISPMGEIGLIPERQLRYIGQIPPERWSSAWSEVIVTAPPTGITTSHVAKTVARIKDELANTKNPELKEPAAQEQQQSFYKHGDLVLIDCPNGAGPEYRRWNGCWAVVGGLGHSGSSVEVVIAGKKVCFMKSDLNPIDSPAPVLKEIAEKVNRLFNREDLDELDKQFLDFYVRRLTFTEMQLDRLAYIWGQYTNEKD